LKTSALSLAGKLLRFGSVQTVSHTLAQIDLSGNGALLHGYVAGYDAAVLANV
jgi:hypothetical protein